MSVAAMMLAVRDALREDYGFSAEECDTNESGQPRPKMGKRFIAIFPGNYRGGPHSDLGIHEYLGINVGVTIRLSGTPKDRVTQDVYLKAVTGIEWTCRRIMASIHRNYDVMNAANAYIPQLLTAADITYDPANIQGFIKPLEWVYTSPVPEVKLGEWFLTDNPQEITKAAGLYSVVTFVDAHRPQQLAFLT